MTAQNNALAPQGLGSDAFGKLFEDLKERSKEKLREIFMGVLSDEQIAQMVAADMDSYLRGAPNKRNKVITDSRKVNSLAELGPLAQIVGEEFSGPRYYQVMISQPNPEYDVWKDPETFPFLVRQVVREKGNKQMVEEILKSETFQTTWAQGSGPFGSGAHVFTEFLKEMFKDDEFLRAMIRVDRETMLSEFMLRTMNNLRSNGRF